MSRFRGRTIVDGVLQHTSASQIDLAASCPRKWWFRHALGIKEPERPSMAHGTEGHRQISEYLLGGPRPTRADVLRGMHMLPAPGADLLVEHEFEHEVDGLPLVGRIDLVSARGDYLGGDNLEPDGLVEVVDWKFVAGARYLPEPADLKGSTQLAEYARWLLDGGEAMPYFPIRLSVGAFVESPAGARKISAAVRREDLEPTWQRSEAVVRQCRELASVATEGDVPADTRACGRYGGCYYRDRCAAARFDPLTKLLGDVPVGLLDALMSITPPAPTAAPETAASLAAEERRAALGPEVIAACDFYRACPRGRPRLTGAAAQAWAAYAREVVDPQVGYAGAGELGELPGAISEVAQLVEVARELGLQVGAVADDARAQLAAQAHPASISPVDAPPSDPPPSTVEAEGKRSRRRERVPVVAPTTEVKTFTSGTASISIAAVSSPAIRPTDQEITAYQAARDHAILRMVGVNVAAHRYDLGAQELRPWVDQLLRDVAGAAGEVGDPRLAEAGPVGYGRWRTAVEALAEHQEIGPGLWLVDCHAGDELTEAALRGLSRRRDLVILRGGRA